MAELKVRASFDPSGVVKGMETMAAGLEDAAANTTRAVEGSFNQMNDQIIKMAESTLDAIANIATKIAAVTTAATSAFVYSAVSFEDSLSTIQRATGATGVELEGMGDSFRRVATTADESFNEIAIAQSTVSTRLGLVGKDLENATSLFLDYADVNRTEVATSIEQVSQLISLFGEEAGGIEAVLDRLTLAQMRYGVNTSELSESLLRSRSAFQMLGFNLNQTIALFGEMDRIGQRPRQVIAGITGALARLQQEGFADANEGLRLYTEKIKNATTEQEAARIGMELFGDQVGNVLAQAIRDSSGRLQGFATELSNVQGLTRTTADNTVTFAERLGELRNQANLLSGEFGQAMIPHLNKLIDGMERLVVVMSGLPDWFKAFVGYGTVITAFSAISIVAITKVISIFLALGVKIAAVSTKIAALSKASLVFAQRISSLFGTIRMAAMKAAAPVLVFIGLLESIKHVGDRISDQNARANREWQKQIDNYNRMGETLVHLTNFANDLGVSLGDLTSQQLEDFRNKTGLTANELRHIAINAQGIEPATREALERLAGRLGLVETQTQRVGAGFNNMERDAATGLQRIERAVGNLFNNLGDLQSRASNVMASFARGAAQTGSIIGGIGVTIGEKLRFGVAAPAPDRDTTRRTGAARTVARDPANELEAIARSSGDIAKILADSLARQEQAAPGLAGEIEAYGRAVGEARANMDAIRARITTAAAKAVAEGADRAVVERQLAAFRETYTKASAALTAEISSRAQVATAARLAEIERHGAEIVSATADVERQVAVERLEAQGRHEEAATQAANNRVTAEKAALAARLAEITEPIDDEIAAAQAKITAAQAEIERIGAQTFDGVAETDQAAERARREARIADMQAESAAQLAAVAGLQERRKVLTDATAEAIAARERALQVEIAGIQADGLQRRIQNDLRANLESIRVIYDERRSALEREIALAGTDEARASAERRLAESEAIRARAISDLYRHTRDEVINVQSDILDGSARLADARTELDSQVAASAIEAERARLNVTVATNAELIASAEAYYRAVAHEMEQAAEAEADFALERDLALRRSEITRKDVFSRELQAIEERNERIRRAQVAEERADTEVDKFRTQRTFIEMRRAELGDPSLYAAEYEDVLDQITEAEYRAAEARRGVREAEGQARIEALRAEQEYIQSLFGVSLLKLEDGAIRFGDIGAQVLGNFQSFTVNFVNTLVQQGINHVISSMVTQIPAMLANMFPNITASITSMLGMTTAASTSAIGTVTTAGVASTTTIAGTAAAANATIETTATAASAAAKGLSATMMSTLGVIGLVIAALSALFGRRNRPVVVHTQDIVGGGRAGFADQVAQPQTIAQFARQANSVVQQFNINVDIPQTFQVSGVGELQTVTSRSILDVVPEFTRLIKAQILGDFALQNVAVGAR